MWVREWQGRGAPHFHVWLSLPVPKPVLTEWWLQALGDYAQRGYHEDQRVSRCGMWEGGARSAAVYAAGYVKKAEGLKAYQHAVPFGASHIGRSWGGSNLGGEVARFIVSHRDARTLRRAYQAKRRSWGCSRKWRDRGVGFTAYDLSATALRLLDGDRHGGAGAGFAGPRVASGGGRLEAARGWCRPYPRAPGLAGSRDAPADGARSGTPDGDAA